MSILWIMDGLEIMAAKPKNLNFTFPVARGTQRFRELIVYISKKCEQDINFGATKLNKILYYSDFRAFSRFGSPLTGVMYQRLPKGPAPKALPPIRQELVSEGAIRVDIVSVGPHEQHRTVALRDPVLEHFTKDELLLVDGVIEELWGQSATEVSNASHDVRWRVLRNKDPIPYQFAFLDDTITPADIARANQLADEFGW